MKIVIKNPAPAGSDCSKWGDYHFGLALQRALERAGATVRQHFWTEWDRDEREDVILVLRGKRRYKPPEGKAAVLWGISHPSTLTMEEIESYNLVFVAGETHRERLSKRTATPVLTLRQCTDPALFTPGKGLPAGRAGVVFVANSRGVQRDIIRWSREIGARPQLIGRGWKALGLGHWVKAEYVDNRELPQLYRGAALGLNDHWADMAYYGYVSNRIFDCLASGLPVLSDDFAELREVCGDGVLYASDATSFREALIEYSLYYPDLMERTAELWAEIGSSHTFDAVASRILEEIRNLPARKAPKEPSPWPQLPDFRQAYRAAIELLRKKGLTKAPKLLHLRGSDAAMEWILEETDGMYLSGGFGPGPWHLALPETEQMMGEGAFDLILADDGAVFESPSALRAAVRHLKQAGGILIVPSHLEPMGIKLVAENAAFRWFERR